MRVWGARLFTLLGLISLSSCGISQILQPEPSSAPPLSTPFEDGGTTVGSPGVPVDPRLAPIQIHIAANPSGESLEFQLIRFCMDRIEILGVDTTPTVQIRADAAQVTAWEIQQGVHSLSAALLKGSYSGVRLHYDTRCLSESGVFAELIAPSNVRWQATASAAVYTQLDGAFTVAAATTPTLDDSPPPVVARNLNLDFSAIHAALNHRLRRGLSSPVQPTSLHQGLANDFENVRGSVTLDETAHALPPPPPQAPSGNRGDPGAR